MSFKSFLEHYADEAISIASTIGTIVSGLALPPGERAKAQATIAALTKAAENILEGIDKVDTPVVKISKAHIEAAVKEVLQPMVDEAVAKALAGDQVATNA